MRRTSPKLIPEFKVTDFKKSLEFYTKLFGFEVLPGGPEEDTSDGFAYGGWQTGWGDDAMGRIIEGFFTIPFELLLGRRTYDIWAAFWPNHPEIELIATPFNSTRKYVVSDTPMELSWNNSVLITPSTSLRTGGDVVAEIKK